MFYANVYETSTSRPVRHNLHARTVEDAKREAEESLTHALAAGSGVLVIYHDGFEDMGPEARMKRTANGTEWLN